MHCDAVARTDRGRRRPHNEDSVLSRPDLAVFAVADGMGGHVAGDVASRIAVETVETALQGRDTAEDASTTADRLADAVRRANDAIREHGTADPATQGMGTTLTVWAAAESGAAYAIAHVGDSRAYRLAATPADHRLEQLTVDHTWVQQQVERGQLTPEQASDHPFGSVLTRGLGAEEDVDADTVTGTLERGDLFLLCSDGLTAHLDDADLAALFDVDGAGGGILDELADAAVDEANRRGGIDNITLVLISADDG